MFNLKGRADGFRLLLPKEFLYKDIEAKYAEILKQKKGFFVNPIDFLNESIQRVQVLGFTDGAFMDQRQTRTGTPTFNLNRVDQNAFQYPSTEEAYRSPAPPIALTDKTLNIEFRHQLGYLNYFMIFENFWYMYSRDMRYSDMMHNIYVDIFDEIGQVYCKINLMDPMMNGMDMLSLDFTQPVAQSQSFKVEFKYSNFEFKFL